MITVDHATNTAHADDRLIQLTGKEADLLASLLKYPGQVVAFERCDPMSAKRQFKTPPVSPFGLTG